jgi:MoaA/NifB/PqqE/SkfB family radical SAM enzyme
MAPAILRKAQEFMRCNATCLFPSLPQTVGAAPLFADLKVTSRCSGRCKSCRYWEQRNEPELSTDVWKAIIRKLKEERILEINFTGGDIFLRDDIFELMSYAIDQGLRVHCTTNGFSLDEEKSVKLTCLRLSSVFISLDDLSTHYDTIRGFPGAAQKVTQSIAVLKKYWAPSPRIFLAMTVMRETIGAMKKVTQYALAQGLAIIFNAIHYTHYFTDTPFSRSQYLLTKKDLQHLRENIRWLSRLRLRYQNLLPRLTHLEWLFLYFQDYHQSQSPCLKPLLKMCVEPNGDVRACCSLDPVGNIARQKLSTIVSSDGYCKIVHKAVTKNCPGCSCHYTLSLDAHVVSRFREIALKTGIANLRLKDSRAAYNAL